MLIMLLALFLVTMFLGTPIAFSMSFASIVTNLTHGASSLMLTAQQCYDSTSNLSLLAVPFFMLAGSIMNMGGISRRLINFCRLFVGRIRGGLAIVAVLAAMIFAAISGSGPATVAALGVFMIPAMVNDGYDVGFAGALMGSAGGLGIIIPPSIPMVIYATLAGCSVGTMFCAGIVPGIILGLAMMIYAYIIARRNGYKPAPVDAPTFKDKAKVFADGLPAIAMPVIILGGIYSGIFTPTQASGIAVIYGLILGVLVYKEIKFKDIVKMFIESGITAASAMLIVSLADGFNWIITTNRVPKMLSDWFLGIFSSAAGILLALIVLLTIKDDLFVFSVEIAGVYGYWTQIIRPIFLSRGSHREAYEVLCQVKEAIQAGVEKFRPGNLICDVDEAINKVAQKYGLSKGVWAGHSMGIDLGDGYNIGESNKMEIVPNMILTFHPSLLDKNGEGVLYADTYVSTEGGARCLTDKYRESPYWEDLKELVK